MTIARRKFLAGAIAVSATAGAGFAAIPFVRSLGPRAGAIKNSDIIDIAGLAPDELRAYSLVWSGIVCVLRRSQHTIEALASGDEYLKDPRSDDSEQPIHAKHALRSLKPEFFIFDAISTESGCRVRYRRPGKRRPGQNKLRHSGDYLYKTGRLWDPCYAGDYDTAGRVTHYSTAPKNLVVPDHEFISDTEVKIYRYRQM